MGQLTYKCKFFRPSPQAQQRGTLAFVTVSMNLDDVTMVESRDWSIRRNQDGGLWPAPPQGQYTDKKTNEKKYYRIVTFWPSQGPNEARNLFEKEILRQYNDWKSGGGEGDGVDAAPAAAAPPRPSAPPPSSKPSLPPGWTMNLDPESGRSYVTDPQGNSLWADDPKVKALMAPKPPAAPRPPASPPPSDFAALPAARRSAAPVASPFDAPPPGLE